LFGFILSFETLPAFYIFLCLGPEFSLFGSYGC